MDDVSPLRQWMDANHPNKETDLQIDRWLDAALATEEALAIEEDEIEPWLLDRSGEPPDFVACVAWYGRARLLTQGWKSLPVDIPEHDWDRWREAGYEPTFDELWERQAGAAGGFLEQAGHDPAVICSVMNQQLGIKIARLEELADLPLEDYTPCDDELEDDDSMDEWNQFGQPFVLRDQLECFAWALQKLRLYCLSDEDPALGLPNPKLFEELKQIDLNHLTARLAAVDPKLRKILSHLAKYNYFQLDNPIDPDHFWWRHWQQQSRRKGGR